ncbi:MAG: DsbE family thiol:disulfide interchange protein [Gammaproteobacteria bacterium]|nr:DsbE family thiol:disulfide interchange protein [Gammaproteobacteria bacterium]
MTEIKQNNKSMLQRFMPLIIFTLLVVLLGVGLTLNPRLIPSPLIGKPVPVFELPLLNKEGVFSSEDFKGQITLLNVWASWCYACRQEHEVVKQLARSGLNVIGFNYKDKKEDAQLWLRQLGNPYQLVMADEDGRAAMDWGVYGAPETFLIDQQGIIRHKVIGPVSDQQNYDELIAAIKKISGSNL